jgi:hypothetical protein
VFTEVSKFKCSQLIRNPIYSCTHHPSLIPIKLLSKLIICTIVLCNLYAHYTGRVTNYFTNYIFQQIVVNTRYYLVLHAQPIIMGLQDTCYAVKSWFHSGKELDQGPGFVNMTSNVMKWESTFCVKHSPCMR